MRLTLLASWLAVVTLGAPASAAAPPPGPGERLDDAMRQVRVRLGFVALADTPLLRDEAEGEVLRAFASGLPAALDGDEVVPERYEQVRKAGLAIDERFPEAPYRLVVEPGAGLPPVTLRLRRHPWSTFHGLPLRGWQARAIGSGLLLRPAAWRPAPAEPTASFD